MSVESDQAPLVINADGVGDEESGELKAEVAVFCHPTRHFRWLVLVFICLLTFGSYFSYDNPAALQRLLLMPPPHGMNMTNFEFNMLYSMYSWPNTVLAFIGGILVDKWLGLRLGGFIFSLLICLGQVIVSIGSQVSSVITMYIGRFVFGLGGENLAVVQNAYTVKYFSGRELNLVFGLALSISRVGSTVNLNVELPIGWLAGLPTAFWIGSILCALSTATAIVLWLLDRYAERCLPPVKPAEAEKLDFTYILRFPFTFWMVNLICVFVYIAIFPFIGIATDFFAKKWPALADQAQTIDSLPYLISGFASPVFGFVVDRVGYNPLFVLGAVVLVLGSHLLLTFTLLTPYVAMVCFGLAYSMCACALWPMVGYLVPAEQTGTAYGIMQALQNLGLAVAPLAVGALQDKDPSNLLAQIFFICGVAASVICAVLLVAIDVVRGRPLRRLMLNRTELAALRERKDDDSLLGGDHNPMLSAKRTQESIRMSYLSRLGFHANLAAGLPATKA